MPFSSVVRFLVSNVRFHASSVRFHYNYDYSTYGLMITGSRSSLNSSVKTFLPGLGMLTEILRRSDI